MNAPIIGLDDFDFHIDRPSPKRNIIGAIRKTMLLIVVIIITAGSTYAYLEYKGENTKSVDVNDNENNSGLKPEVKGLSTCTDPDSSPLKNITHWWNEDYKYFSQLSIKNNDSFDKEKITIFRFNHKLLVDNSHSLASGNDIRMVIKVSDNFLQIPFEVNNPNSTETEIVFKTAQEYENPAYFIYYGNAQAENKSQKINGDRNEELSYTISMAGETHYPISVETNRKWALINYDEEPLTLEVNIDKNLGVNIPAINYEIDGTDITSAIIPNEDKYSTRVNIDDLKPGEYKIRATLGDECFTLKSQPQKFYVSYPLFVVWSMDWEGQSVNPNYLNQISEISKKYDIPMTQLFNPRIFITDSISEENKTLMTNWIKDRRDKNKDEIGLHVHMWFDMLRAAGVTPKNTPNWASMNTGYDVLFTSYNTSESDKILKWSIAEMKRHGFTNLETFRAGGWEIDEENMAALEKNGFKIDTSGRTHHKIGVNLVSSKWTLAKDQKPFQPSKQDINKTSADHFNLWEFPNNGGESYVYSYEQMKERFDLNYNGNFMSEPQVLTYLSHPHWFNIDYPKLQKLFGDIDAHKFTADRGPIVYTTLSDAHNYWEKNLVK